MKNRIQRDADQTETQIQWEAAEETRRIEREDREVRKAIARGEEHERTRKADTEQYEENRKKDKEEALKRETKAQEEAEKREKALQKASNDRIDETNRIQTESNQTQQNLAEILSQLMQVTVNLTQQSKDEAEAREERHQKNLIQLFERIAPMNQNRIPQSTENTNEFALSLSNLTHESNQIIAITPLARMQVPKKIYRKTRLSSHR